MWRILVNRWHAPSRPHKKDATHGYWPSTRSSWIIPRTKAAWQRKPRGNPGWRKIPRKTWLLWMGVTGHQLRLRSARDRQATPLLEHLFLDQIHWWESPCCRTKLLAEQQIGHTSLYGTVHSVIRLWQHTPLKIWIKINCMDRLLKKWIISRTMTSHTQQV